MEIDCLKCGQKIVLRFLNPGEEYQCKHCGHRQIVSENTKEIPEEISDAQQAINENRCQRYKITFIVLAFIHFFILLWYVCPSVEGLISEMKRTKFGGIAIEPLKRIGPAAIPDIKEYTRNFTNLSYFSTKRMMIVFSSSGACY